VVLLPTATLPATAITKGTFASPDPRNRDWADQRSATVATSAVSTMSPSPRNRVISSGASGSGVLAARARQLARSKLTNGEGVPLPDLATGS